MNQQQKLQKLRSELHSWNPLKGNPPQVELNTEALADALLKAGKEYERKAYDREIIAWAHLVMLALGKRGKFPYGPVSKKRLFAVLNNQYYQNIMKYAKNKCHTDEVPTQFMRDLFEEFKQWSKEHPRTTRR